MAQWRKKFDRWRDIKTPVPVDEVEALLRRVFGDRVREAAGTSHRFHVSVPELKDDDEFLVSALGFPVSGGQHVKGPYLRLAYKAAQRLGLLGEEQESEEDGDAEI